MRGNGANTDPPPQGNRTLLFALVSILIFAVFFEILAQLGLVALKKVKGVKYMPIYSRQLAPRHEKITRGILENKMPYYQVDSLTGWSIGSSRANGNYVSNFQGLRANQEYNQEPPGDKVRVATFGDSFTHCDGVNNQQTWQFFIEEKNSGFQMINFGVGGFGLDQAYLRYKELGLKYNPDVVFIGFMPENIKRVVNVYRPFYISGSRMPLTKPRFTLENGKLTLVPNPMAHSSDYALFLNRADSLLPALGANDFHYSASYHQGPFDFLGSIRFGKIMLSKVIGQDRIMKLDGSYNTENEAFHVTWQIFKKFYGDVEKTGALPIVVLFGTPTDLGRMIQGKDKRYAALLSKMREQNFNVIDGIYAFDSPEILQDYNSYFSGHYNARGNELVGDYIAREMKGILEKNSLPRFANQEKRAGLDPSGI